MGFERSDLDADWAVFDFIRQVRLQIRNADDSFGAAQTVDAMDAASYVFETYRHDEIEGGSVFVNQTTVALRASQVTGVITKGSKVTDWDGKVWYVEWAQKKTLDSRWMVVLRV